MDPNGLKKAKAALDFSNAAFIDSATCYSPKVNSLVPSPLRGLTSVFGMGTGGSLSL